MDQEGQKPVERSAQSAECWGSRRERFTATGRRQIWKYCKGKDKWMWCNQNSTYNAMKERKRRKGDKNKPGNDDSTYQ